jgi:hypothetical protein
VGKGGKGFRAARDFIQRVGLPVKSFIGMRAFSGGQLAEGLYGSVPTAGVYSCLSPLENALVISPPVGGILEEALGLRRRRVLRERQPDGGQRGRHDHQET